MTTLYKFIYGNKPVYVYVVFGVDYLTALK